MNYYDTIVALTKKELKIRYKHHALGYLWSISNPLTYAFIYFITFKLVMKVKVEDFPIFLIAGLFPWQWIANSISVGPMTFLGNAPLIKKVNFPRYLIPLVVVIQDMIHFIISIPIILIMLFLYAKSPTISWILGVPLLALIQLLFTYSLNLLTATLNLFLRDIEKLVTMGTTFLFFFTPIVYKAEMIPEKYQYLLNLNPAAPIIICWRDLFLNGFINWPQAALAITWATILTLGAQYIYKRLSWRFAEVL